MKNPKTPPVTTPITKSVRLCLGDKLSASF